MVLRRINNLLLILIILCSTSFYQLAILGPVQRIIELTGIGLIIFLLAIHIIYSEEKVSVPQHFIWPILFIFISILTSMLMAKYGRGQGFGQTLYAQRPLYYYLLYFLLHQMKIKTEDIEKIFLGLGFLFVFLYLLQFSIYPTIIYDAYVRSDRGTIRIYLAGSAYFGIAFYMCTQYFYRTNQPKYFIYLLIFFLIFVLTGGRQQIAIVLFVVTLFLLFDKKVKSKLILGFLGMFGIFLLFIMFQSIFESILSASESDLSKGEDYIRFLAAEYFLTDFFKYPIAYITGNGMYSFDSSYGHEIARVVKNDHFNLSDIGIIGNYAMYGFFFVLGVFTLLFKALKLKIEQNHSYIKYTMIGVILALLTSGSFAHSDFICFMMCIIYMIDVSNHNLANNSPMVINAAKSVS